ncbi:ATP-dependent DNA helicase [Ornithinimicrobium faecis]|uniref:DNA 3'-5' helicase n=1 Tax=Ornithinimicrobium faecis TaxID=2934158 RepID=A0ABY4YWD1_9MICO|nr:MULTISPECIES: ATP-dependent DNA helicase [unclassified Ornithinimicrobium]USQ81044.1 ATP-dependent helicase [Ornithinimicrobium sp. HY1793]
MIGALEIASALGQLPPTQEQVAVIEAPLEPTLVVAGAGSGKTETMASRVVWLVVNGVARPEEVLGLTFTRKAAIELGERIGRRLRAATEQGLWTAEDDEVPLPEVSTYHAYAGRLVSEHGLRWGIEPDSRLLSEASAWQLAHEVVHTTDADLAGFEKAPATLVDAVLSLSGELAEHLVETRSARELVEHYAARLAAMPGRDHKKPLKLAAETADDLLDQARVYPLVERYRELKRARGTLDFADQMAIAARLAATLPAVGAQERQLRKAVLLDEFQDTSEAQMVLLSSLFAGEQMPLTAVGDPSQSIYGWRGASATTLSSFPEIFPAGDRPAAVLPLSTSWRNAQRILTVANDASSSLRRRSRVPVTQLQPRPGADTGTVRAARLLTHRDEAGYVAEWVRGHWIGADGEPTGRTAAVLCRNRAQFDEVVQALRGQGLPVEIVGLGGLLSAPEVADLVALLTVAQDPTRGDALMRLLTGPVCRLGAADLDGLWAWVGALAHSDGLPRSEAVLSDALDRLPPVTWAGSRGRRVSETARARVRALGQAVDRVRSLAGLPLPELLVEAERAIGLDLEVTSNPDLPPAWGRAQLDALAEVAAGFSVSAERPTLGGFVDWLEAARERERGLEMAEVSVSDSAVQVLTVHAAKGLEWDVVAVPGLAEGIFPSYTTRTRPNGSEWSASTPKDRGWLTGLGKLPYPLRGDVAGLPALPLDSVVDTHELKEAVEDFGLAGGRHQVDEERRLAYVAFTRARHDLMVTAPVWSTGQTPRQTSRFLEEVIASPDGGVEVAHWAPMPDPDDPTQVVNPLLAEEQLAPWPTVPDARRRLVTDVVQAVLDARRAGAVPAADPDDPVGLEVTRLLRERAELRAAREVAGHAQLPEHLSTSGLVELTADKEAYLRALRRPVPGPPAHAARAGTSFHAWVERHFGMPSLVEVEGLQADSDHELVDLSTMRANFLASEWAGQSPVEIEVPVETVLGGRAVRGRIDAVFGHGDGFVVVDWKTGARGGGERERTRVLQLAVYRVAYARLRGIDPERVSAAFFYAATGETVRPDLHSEQELEDLLAGLADAAPVLRP